MMNITESYENILTVIATDVLRKMVNNQSNVHKRIEALRRKQDQLIALRMDESYFKHCWP